MKLKNPVSFQTPAKVNFFLFIQRKRDDGYHELLMDLVPISLFDAFQLSPYQGSGIILESNLTNVPLEQNLLVKAIRILERETGKTCSMKIQQVKNIPSGAGLGGGSGNAAGFLVVLNQLFQLGFSPDQLRKLALELGADVPFFIEPQPMLAEGIGEKLSPLPAFEPLSLLLLSPNFPISTGEAYQNCKLSGRTEAFQQHHLGAFEQHQPELNDFWEPLSRKYPKLEICCEELRQAGAISWGMSGSGSTLYGVFRGNQARDRAYHGLKGKGDWELFPVETLTGFRYLD
ncbi:MAG: 4-(cytidine 5'-diphospho)-2-C-methyl-D-erythritol kinase [SAR324 cluster bacterium]|uniref:4-diphosphocytidyl-2-C-methyl-D-erythritol kinase n=1 Tax=SAR324 cluster bacterium TaxID=2024889 RepID=A0A2A4SQI8_9DELT|nr:MAG: 4-(cytidine 5'-diphospho)-2-C-methyl-D-erythritol kinase [SAR324 cluster bacterium]